MYSQQIVQPAPVVEPARPRLERPVWLRAPSLFAMSAVLILAVAVALALIFSGNSRIHTSIHKVPAATQSAPHFTPPLVPHGYVRIPTTHQLIPLR